ncbi:hypothetical protein NP493_1987g00009, partial [Ridgeia piscesae]
ICNPRCQNNALCYDVNKCYCRSGHSGHDCGVAKCSYTTNCYPGTCRHGASSCACSGGFEGSNCDIIRDSPDFKICQLRLMATSGGTEKVVFTGQCNATHRLYSNRHDISYVVMDWRAVYDRPTDIPHKPPYIGEVGIGVISTNGRVRLYNTGHKQIYDRRVSCPFSPVSPNKPHFEATCPNIRHKWREGVSHRFSLEATMTAATGGFKTVLNTDTQQTYRTTYSGSSNSKTVVVTFDLEPPKHCSVINNCTAENNVPIDVGREIDNNRSATRNVMWFGWTDADSGVEWYYFSVFQLTPNKEAPGMYSVVLKVEDSAGNAAFARSLLLWDPLSNVTITDRPMSVAGDTGLGDGFSWLNSAVDTTHPLRVTWHGHFENTFQKDNKLLNELRTTILDGEFIRVFVVAVDVMGNNATDSLVVGVDTTPPRFVKHNFEKNVDSGDPQLPFSSRIDMRAYDRESGIRGIEYVVTDVVTGARDIKACQDEKTCDCTPLKECFYVTQVFHLDNCWFIRGEGHVYRVDATIYNQAGLSTPAQLNLGVLEGFSGINLYQSVKNLTVVKKYGDKVEIWWQYDVSCYVTKGVKITYTTASNVRKEVTLPAAQSSYVLDDLDPNKDYSVVVVAVYEGSETNGNRRGGLAVGAIVGIVIVMLILVVVIVLLVLFILTRRRHEEPFMPRDFDDFRRTVRQSVAFGGIDNVTTRTTAAIPMKDNVSRSRKPAQNNYMSEYQECDDDDVYLYGNMVTDSVATWKIPAEKVELVQRLPNAKGRFADIYEATLMVKNGKQKVVAKRLKQRGKAADEHLMTAKMNFFATACPKHENILQFVGAVTQGPILLFEVCDLGRLRDWLVAQTKVTEDLEDKMITICLHIARGMKQLHAKEFVHRRLGARNVLLKSAGTDVIIAKIAGFGPMKGEQAPSSDDANEKIPVKWMALEQLSVAEGEKRKYDQKTDVWSFGVTSWEVFSKGEVPYPDKSSSQMKGVLDGGYRLPRPTYCPDIMYDKVMQPCWNTSSTSRPSFADVVNTIETSLSGGGAGDEYYYDTSKQGQDFVQDDGLYQNNLNRKPH